jgi:hypothetical protein
MTNLSNLIGVATQSAGLLSASSVVDVSAATAPSSGQVLTATSASAATWQNPTTGTVTTMSVVSANGFAGTVATATTTPAVTLTCSITGILKGNGTAISAASAGTDYMAPVLWTKTSSTTVSNSIVQTSILGGVGTGVGTLTIPANRLAVGTTVRLRLMGVYGDTTSAPTLSMEFRFGATVVCTTAALTMTTTSMSNKVWVAEVDVTCRSTGASGTVFGTGYLEGFNSTTAQNVWQAGGTGAITIDTTVTKDIDVLVQFNSAHANNLITCTNCTVEIIG